MPSSASDQTVCMHERMKIITESGCTFGLLAAILFAKNIKK